MFLIMSYTSASKLLSSSFCGGHFLDLKPKLLSMALLLSSLSLSRFVLLAFLFLTTFATNTVKITSVCIETTDLPFSSTHPDHKLNE